MLITKVKTWLSGLGIAMVALAAGSHAQQAEPAQGESAALTGLVTGTVYDARTASPIRGALVQAARTDRSTLTDVDGRYRLSLPAGTYRLQVSAPGYFAQPVDDVVVAARSEVFPQKG